MKRLYLIVLSVAVISCSNQLEIEGNWVILEMAHYGKKVYPETVSDKIRISLNPIGYEGAEKIKFNVIDSIVSFPGFQSDILEARFSIRGDSIFFRELNRKQVLDNNHELTKRTFLRDFKIIQESRSGNIRLKSDMTIIRLVNESYLNDKRLDEIFGR